MSGLQVLPIYRLLFIIFFISQLPLLRGYMMITNTSCIQQCMGNFFEPHMKTQISLWQALCIVFILKAAVFEICGFSTILISKKIKDELIVTASMTAMTVISALILYTFKSIQHIHYMVIYTIISCIILYNSFNFSKLSLYK